MFAGLECPKPPKYKPRPVPKPSDVPGNRANSSGHIAREPNTCYNLKLMQYNQRKVEVENKIALETRKVLDEESIVKKYMTHNVHKSFQRSLNDKVSKKQKQYEVDIDVRRKKLGEILWKEERELGREVVDTALTGKLERLQEKLEKINEFKERNEAERLALVKEKKLQQYVSRCAEFRPALANQRLQESKAIQLLQIEENKSRKQSEIELENMWHEMKMKYCEAIDEREEQDRLQRLKQNNEFKYFSALQAKEKELQREKMREEMLADRQRLDQLRKDLEEEKRADREKQHIKKKEMLHMCQEQIKEREEMLKRIADQEQKIQRAYDELADIEIAREQAAIKNKVSTGYQDMINYQRYLEELREEKEEEARRVDEIVERQLKEIQQKDDDRRCKAIMAKQALLELVLKEREQQIEERRKQEAELQKANELEMELAKASREQNEKLRKEYERQNWIKAKKYREMLQQQIEYSKILQERENENMRKILESGKIENQVYENIVAEVLSGTIKICETHAFRQVINNEKCPCPKPNY